MWKSPEYFIQGFLVFLSLAVFLEIHSFILFIFIESNANTEPYDQDADTDYIPRRAI
jgi:hypothetical protein